MKMHRANEILNKIVTQLKTEATITVFRRKTRKLDLEELPVICVAMGEEDGTSDFQIERRELIIELDLNIASAEDEVDAALLNLREIAEIKMASVPQLGLTYVTDVKFLDVSPVDSSGEGEKPTANYTMRYQVDYRYPPGQPSV